MQRLGVCALALVALSACNGAEGSLFVALRTDLVPMAEFAAVRVERFESIDALSEEPLEIEDRIVRLDDDFLGGERVAEFPLVPLGDQVLRVRLQGLGGGWALQKIAIVQVGESQAATVVMTRDCRGVECPDAAGSASALACLGGECADPECTIETSEFCPDAACSGDGDCGGEGLSACASPTCQDGVCLAARGDDMCGAGEYCEPELGCVAEPVETASGCVADIALGTLSMCVLFTDGHVECRGRGIEGQLGTGVTGNSPTFRRIPGIDTAWMITGFSFGYCVVQADNAAYCWGDNGSGRFGDVGDPVDTPVRIEVEDAANVAFGSTSGCVVNGSGELFCQGANELGQLLDGTTTSSTSPVRADLPGTARFVAGGYDGICVVLEDDRVFCGGYTGFNGFPTPRQLDTDVTGIRSLTAHAPSFYAITRDHRAVVWGRNGDGQLGLGTVTDNETPTEIPMARYRSMAGGQHFGCGVELDGTVLCWGGNDRGQLGTVGTPMSSPTPVEVTGIPSARYVRSSQEHVCIMGENGEIWCWGHACCQQITDGYEDAVPPTRVDVSCPGGG